MSTRFRVTLTLIGFTLAAALAALPGPLVAHGSTIQPQVTAQAVVRLARSEYSLPATKATCWSTGPRTFSCWVSGGHGFRAVAVGSVLSSGGVTAVFS